MEELQSSMKNLSLIKPLRFSFKTSSENSLKTIQNVVNAKTIEIKKVKEQNKDINKTRVNRKLFD